MKIYPLDPLRDSDGLTLEVRRVVEEWLAGDGTYENLPLALVSLTTLCAPMADPRRAPRLLHVGSRSGQRLAFGDDWADNAWRQGTTPFGELEATTAPGYCAAHNHGLYADIVVTDLEVPGGKLVYERAIMPVTVGGKPGFTLLAGSVLESA